MTVRMLDQVSDYSVKLMNDPAQDVLEVLEYLKLPEKHCQCFLQMGESRWKMVFLRACLEVEEGLLRRSPHFQQLFHYLNFVHLRPLTGTYLSQK